MPNSELTIAHKRFIVMLLASYESPSDVIDAVKEKFSVIVTRQQLQHYDPNTVAGKDLAKTLKDLFETTRTEFEAKEPVPLSKKVARVKRLQNYVDKFENMGNLGKAMEAMAQIAKEEGGMFTNRKEITGAGGKPIEIHSKTLDDWKNDAERRTNEAAAVLDIFENADEETNPS